MEKVEKIAAAISGGVLIEVIHDLNYVDVVKLVCQVLITAATLYVMFKKNKNT